MDSVEVSFQAEIVEQFPEFIDVVRASVYGCGRPFKHVAADLEMAPSKLSRMLADNPNDKLSFPLDLLPDLIRSTEDLRPVHWLVATFVVDAEDRRKKAVDEMMNLIPQIESLLRSAKHG